MTVDQDAVEASLDLARRSGAHTIEFGFLHDDVPAEEADWWAHAQYRGARISVERHRGPVEALQALAQRLLHGARCRRCGQPIRLSDDERGCRWTRQGKRWEPGCGKPVDLSIKAPA